MPAQSSETSQGLVLRILHLEDNPLDVAIVQSLLESDGIRCEIRRVQTQRDFETALEQGGFDLIISDFTLPGFDGLSALELARKQSLCAPFIFCSGTIGEEVAIESLKEGAVDYVLKNHLSRLPAAVRRAVGEAQGRAERQRVQEELRQRDELFRKITDNVDDLVAVLDLEGHRLFNSPSYQRLLGDSNALIGTEAFVEIHPEDRERVKRIFRETVFTGRGQRSEYRFLLNDGSVRYIESQGSVVRDKEGKIANIVVVSRDITERKQAEERNREQAALLDKAPDAICVTDIEQLVRYWNKGAERLYGWTAEEAVGRNATELLFQGEITAPLTALKSIIANGEWHGELEQVTKAGKKIVVESRWALTREESGKPKSIMVINTDITERKLAALRIQEQAALLDKATDAIFVCELDQLITYWNKGSERLYGWTAQDVLRKRADQLLYKNHSPQLEEIGKALFERGESFAELAQVTKIGKEIVVESRQTLLRDSAGQPSAILIINTDITEKKQIEEQFLRAQRMENIGALAGGIAHDLNNVLGPILLVGALLREELASEGSRAMLDTATASAQRGAEMVKQILSFARGVGGERVVLKVGHLVKEMDTLAKDTFPKSIHLQTNVAAGLRPIMGDATQLHQVLLNLCVNARDAMPDGGTLSIDAKDVVLDRKQTRMHEQAVSGPFVVLTISDTGTGIARELLDRIFEPFFTTKEQGTGTGLGLSTVLSIVKSHAGFVEVSSEVGKGTTFKVYLPATATTESELARQEQSPPPPMGQGQQVLLVDDELAILEITKETLETFNYRVLTASDGVEAVPIFRQRQGEINIVVTDLMMPIMNGPALIRALRQLDPHMKVLVVSGLGSKAQLAEAEKLNVQGFLAKPYTTEKLLTVLDEVLNAKV